MKRTVTVSKDDSVIVKKARTTKPTATKRSIMGVLRSLGMQPETKYFDSAQQSLAVVAAGTMNTINALIPQGQTDNERIGSKIAITGLEIRGYLILGTTTSQQGATIYLFLDKQPNGAFPSAAITTTLNTSSTAVFQAGGATSNGSILLKNCQVSERFKILHNKNVVHSNYMSLTSADVQSFGQSASNPFYINKRFKKPIITEYSASTGAITDISTNNLVFGAAEATGGTFTMRYLARVYYHDV